MNRLVTIISEIQTRFPEQRVLLLKYQDSVPILSVAGQLNSDVRDALPIELKYLVNEIQHSPIVSKKPTFFSLNYPSLNFLVFPVFLDDSIPNLILVQSTKLSFLKKMVLNRWWRRISRKYLSKLEQAVHYNHIQAEEPPGRRAEDLLYDISKSTSVVAGSDFFKSLIKNLALILKVHQAFITECTDQSKKRVRTLAMFAGNTFVENMEYDLMGTPCERVIQGEVTYHSEKLPDFYKMHMGMEAYLGVPVKDSSGNVLGHMVVMDDKTMVITNSEIAVIKIFANRAGLELERLHMDAALKAANQHLERKVDERTQRLKKTNMLLENEIRLKEQNASNLKKRIRAEKFISALSFRLLSSKNNSVYKEIYDSLSELAFLLSSPFIFFKSIKHVAEKEFFYWVEEKVHQSFKINQPFDEAFFDKYSQHIEPNQDIEIEFSEIVGKNNEIMAQKIPTVKIIPIYFGSELAAVFGAGMIKNQSLQSGDYHLVNIVSRLFYLALENQFRENALKNISAIAVSSSSDEFLNKVLEWLKDVLNADEALIFKKKENSEELIPVFNLTTLPLPEQSSTLCQLNYWNPLYQNGSHQLINEISKQFKLGSRHPYSRFQTCVAHCIPSWNEDVMGHVAVFFNGKRHISPWEDAMIELFMARIGSELMREDSFRMLEHAKRQAELASLGKTRFVANISHDLRTPLNSILGYSQLLIKKKSLSDDDRKKIKAILDSGIHLSRMINDLLDLSAIENGKIRAEMRKMDLNALGDELKLLYLPTAQLKGITLTVKVIQKAGSVIYTDPDKLKRILTNLLSNAIKYTDHGMVKLEMNLLENQSDKGDLHIKVEDSGTGMSDAEINKIFEPFYQIDDPNRPRDGSGLGLSIVREFLQILSGDIQISSQPGQGTCIHVTIPVRLKTLQLSSPEKIPTQIALPSREKLTSLLYYAEIGDIIAFRTELLTVQNQYGDFYAFLDNYLNEFDLDAIVAIIETWRSKNGSK